MPPLSVSSAGQRNKSPFEGRLRFAFQGFYFRAASKAATEYTAVWSLEKRSLLDENRSPLLNYAPYVEYLLSFGVQHIRTRQVREPPLSQRQTSNGMTKPMLYHKTHTAWQKTYCMSFAMPSYFPCIHGKTHVISAPPYPWLFPCSNQRLTFWFQNFSVLRLLAIF